MRISATKIADSFETAKEKMLKSVKGWGKYWLHRLKPLQ